MRKTAVFATVMGLFAATALAAATTYQLVKLYQEKEEKKNKEAEPDAPDLDAVPENATAEVIENDAVAEDIPENGAKKKDVLLKDELEEDDVPLRADDAGRDICYYLPQSKIWHSDDTCAFIAGKPGIITSTVAKANAAGKKRGCTRCGA